MKSPRASSRVKILICSYAFSPSVGGIESVSALLGAEFLRQGHEVKLVTETAGETNRENGFEVSRHPSEATLFSSYRWADVVWHNNLSMRLLWPALIRRRPCFVTTQTWLSGAKDRETRMSRLKRLILKGCRNISISHAIAEHIRVPSVVLGNPYDASCFAVSKEITRELKLVFVGRLVSDKGLLLLLQALAQLQTLSLYPSLTVIGSGPEQTHCEDFVKKSGLDQQVSFLGALSGQPLAATLNAHEILVIPSRWAEPFGIVALEGIACGCVVVGTKDGGLKEAIGPCGILCENNNVDALADALRLLLSDEALRITLRSHAESHLQQFSPSLIAGEYLGLFERTAV